jgi:hypothetical protein
LSRWKLAGPTPWRSLAAIGAIALGVALALDAAHARDPIRYLSSGAARSDLRADILALGVLFIPGVVIERVYFWWRRRRRQ